MELLTCDYVLYFHNLIEEHKEQDGQLDIVGTYILIFLGISCAYTLCHVLSSR